MKDSGWPALVNPCGVVYNPVSMAVIFQLALTHRSLRRDIIESSITTRDDGIYVSWFMGSSVRGTTPEECADRVCEAIDRLEEGIEGADALVLTFGTSDVWILSGTDRAVGNCHKHPAAEFERRRAGIDEIVGVWRQIVSALRARNPELKVIFTVSPRRYLGDGFADNSRQKAVLLLACEQLAEGKSIYYFPSYEIMNDDLRDYRFYAKDLLHPSDMAIDYIWEKFRETYLDAEGETRLRALEKEARRRAHRPIL